MHLTRPASPSILRSHRAPSRSRCLRTSKGRVEARRDGGDRLEVHQAWNVEYSCLIPHHREYGMTGCASVKWAPSKRQGITGGGRGVNRRKLSLRINFEFWGLNPRSNPRLGRHPGAELHIPVSAVADSGCTDGQVPARDRLAA